MVPFPKTTRKEVHGRHVAIKRPWWQSAPKEANSPALTDTKSVLSAEHHVLEVRKLAARECRRYSTHEKFTVIYEAPDELKIEMAMQFIAHADQGTDHDGSEPFTYIARNGNEYIFQAT